MSETQTLYKLIILYILNHVAFPLSNAQLSEFILDKEYTDYFTLQQSLFELTDSALIHPEKQHNTTLYHITEEGRTTLTYFEKKNILRHTGGYRHLSLRAQIPAAQRALHACP